MWLIGLFSSQVGDIETLPLLLEHIFYFDQIPSICRNYGSPSSNSFRNGNVEMAGKDIVPRCLFLGHHLQDILRFATVLDPTLPTAI